LHPISPLLKPVGTTTTDESVGLSDLSQSTKILEEEVQRGVERVLLAILERASNSRGRAASSSDSQQPSATARLQLQQPDLHTQTQTSSGSIEGGGVNHSGDSLIRAMEELLGQVTHTSASSVGSATSSQLSRGVVGKDETSIATGKSSQKTVDRSVVDELLAEDEEDEDRETTVTLAQPNGCLSPASDMAAMRWSHYQEEKKSNEASSSRNNNSNNKAATTTLPIHGKQDNYQEGSTFSDMIDSALRSSNDRDEEKDDGDDDEEDAVQATRSLDAVDDEEGSGEENNDSYTDVDEEDEDHKNTSSLSGVLGPLSKRAGGTTGVVLDIQSSPENEEEKNSILESLSNVMVDASNIMNYVAGTGTGTMSTQPKPKELENSTQYHLTDKYSVDEDDIEAMELMRTLCAHLLPFGVDQSNQLEVIPAWDENVPNEAGYRIIRLTKAQLRRVERAFELMVNGFLINSERQLNGIDLTTSTLKGIDPNFVRDLQEAEKLLDDEERRVNAVQTANEIVKKSNVKQQFNNSDTEDVSSSEICHVDFPGVKSTGKGEMGDLEFFNLPIIFKSSVTGFEPTKDLMLEPGNVVAGQYLVESELGSAAFSTAYRCIDLSSDDGEDVSIRKLPF
jgi:hypothetical protein